MPSNRFIQDRIDDGSLRCYLDFRSGSLRDWSGNSNNGTATASTVWIDNKALFFPTGACVQTPSIDLTATNNVTVACIAATRVVSGINQWFFEFSSNYSVVTTGFIAYVSANPQKYSVSGHVGDVGVSSILVPSGATYQPNLASPQLHAFTYDKGAAGGSECTYYNNGLLSSYDNSGVANNTNNFGNHVLNIGSQNNGTGFPLLGKMWAILLFNRKLTALEHSLLYDALKRLD